MGGRDCSGGNQDANGDFVSYINTFDLDHFQTLLSKILYIEVPPIPKQKLQNGRDIDIHLGWFAPQYKIFVSLKACTSLLQGKRSNPYFLLFPN